jgi:hypothetical protein
MHTWDLPKADFSDDELDGANEERVA